MHQTSFTPPERWWTAAAPAVAIAVACIVAGGLIAAVTAHDPTHHGIWMVAYLVLVGGIAQGGLGLGQALLGQQLPARTARIAELGGFNLGNTCVIAGTLADRPWLVDIGGALLAIALILFLRGVRGVPLAAPVLLYRALIIFVLGSIPIGLILAQR